MAVGAAAVALLVLGSLMATMIFGAVAYCVWKAAMLWLEHQGQGHDARDYADRRAISDSEAWRGGAAHADGHGAPRRRHKASRTAEDKFTAASADIPEKPPVAPDALPKSSCSHRCEEVFDEVPVGAAGPGHAGHHGAAAVQTQLVQVAEVPPAAEIQVSMVAPPLVSMEDLHMGFACKLANEFRGNHEVHAKNVATVAGVYNLQHSDICYCFLVLEEIASMDQGLLSVKMHGTGPYSARLWVVILARFVRAAQMDLKARDEFFLHALSDEWRYSPEKFRNEVISNEELFFRKHGQRLIAAFQLDEVRVGEVGRATRSLAALAAAMAPRRAPRGGASQATFPIGGASPLAALPATPSALPWVPAVDPAVLLQASPHSALPQPWMHAMMTPVGSQHSGSPHMLMNVPSPATKALTDAPASASGCVTRGRGRPRGSGSSGGFAGAETGAAGPGVKDAATASVKKPPQRRKSDGDMQPPPPKQSLQKRKSDADLPESAQKRRSKAK